MHTTLADRMTEASVDAVTTEYIWSGEGIRLSAATCTDPEEITRFVVDRGLGLPVVVEERDGDDETVRTYDYALGLVAAGSPPIAGTLCAGAVAGGGSVVEGGAAGVVGRFGLGTKLAWIPAGLIGFARGAVFGSGGNAVQSTVCK